MVEPYIENGVIPLVGKYKEVIGNIHTQIVEETINSYSENRILNAPAPPVNDAVEKNLPRSVRTTLSQLRSGFCAKLKDFLHRIVDTFFSGNLGITGRDAGSNCFYGSTL